MSTTFMGFHVVHFPRQLTFFNSNPSTFFMYVGISVSSVQKPQLCALCAVK